MYRLLIRLIKLSYMQTSCAYVHPPTLQKGPIRASKNPGNVYCRYFCLNWAIKRRNVKTMHKSHQSTPPRFPQYFYVFKSRTLLLWKIAIHSLCYPSCQIIRYSQYTHLIPTQLGNQIERESSHTGNIQPEGYNYPTTFSIWPWVCKKQNKITSQKSVLRNPKASLYCFT